MPKPRESHLAFIIMSLRDNTEKTPQRDKNPLQTWPRDRDGKGTALPWSAFHISP